MGQGIIFQNKKILDPSFLFLKSIYFLFLILFDHCFYRIFFLKYDLIFLRNLFLKIIFLFFNKKSFLNFNLKNMTK